METVRGRGRHLPSVAWIAFTAVGIDPAKRTTAQMTASTTTTSAAKSSRMLTTGTGPRPCRNTTTRLATNDVSASAWRFRYPDRLLP
jgi:hypothetical protein